MPTRPRGQAAILGIDENPGRLALGMDNLSYLKGLSGHAGMEVNVRSDRQADAAAKQGVDREWHETDYNGLLYEDPTEEEN
eukprot:3939591-Rhodomonas_salina.1